MMVTLRKILYLGDKIDVHSGMIAQARLIDQHVQAPPRPRRPPRGHPGPGRQLHTGNGALL